jgi:predicted DNA-binding protein (MmcQ/YjbR family)
MGARPITVVMDARTYALSLPEAEEQVHHGMASFRGRGKMFATVPEAEHIRVMAGEAEILAAVATDSTSCE